MAKRRASAQLTKENCEDEDLEENSGEFQKADKNEISNRVIKTARRRSSNVSSPLASFPGFGATPSKSSPFSFLNKPTTTNEPKPDATAGATTKAEKLKSLNLNFVKWVQKHLDDDPYVVLIPVFKDYEKHFESIKFEPGALSTASSGAEKITMLPPTPAVAPTPKTDPPTFNFFTPTTSSTNTPRVGAGLFNFMNNDSKSEKIGESKPSFSFGGTSSEAPKTSGFSFGLNSNPPSFNSKRKLYLFYFLLIICLF